VTFAAKMVAKMDEWRTRAKRKARRALSVGGGIFVGIKLSGFRERNRSESDEPR
jgi:hypothetical protein